MNAHTHMPLAGRHFGLRRRSVRTLGLGRFVRWGYTAVTRPLSRHEGQPSSAYRQVRSDRGESALTRASDGTAAQIAPSCARDSKHSPSPSTVRPSSSRRSRTLGRAMTGRASRTSRSSGVRGRRAVAIAASTARETLRSATTARPLHQPVGLTLAVVLDETHGHEPNHAPDVDASRIGQIRIHGEPHPTKMKVDEPADSINNSGAHAASTLGRSQNKVRSPPPSPP